MHVLSLFVSTTANTLWIKISAIIVDTSLTWNRIWERMFFEQARAADTPKALPTWNPGVDMEWAEARKKYWKGTKKILQKKRQMSAQNLHKDEKNHLAQSMAWVFSHVIAPVPRFHIYTSWPSCKCTESKRLNPSFQPWSMPKPGSNWQNRKTPRLWNCKLCNEPT